MIYFLRSLLSICNGLTVLGAALGVFVILYSFPAVGVDTSAFAIAMVAIPYCVGAACHRSLLERYRDAEKKGISPASTVR